MSKRSGGSGRHRSGSARRRNPQPPATATGEQPVRRERETGGPRTIYGADLERERSISRRTASSQEVRNHRIKVALMILASVGLFLWALWTIYSASVEAAAEGLDPGQPQLVPSIEAGLLAFLAAFAMAQAIRLLREGPRPRAAGRGRRR